MAASKKRRSAFDDDTDQVTDLPTIIVSPAVASTSKNKDTTVTSRPNYMAGKRTPPPKSKRKLANGRGSTTEPSTLTKPPAVTTRRVTRASSVSTSSRMPTGLAKGIRDMYPHLTTTKDALDSDEPLREEHRGTGKLNPTLKKNGGRPPRTIHLADEAAKVALMEQWANLRMSQGTLLSNTTASRLSDTTHSQEPPSGGRPEVEISPCEVVGLNESPDFTAASDHIEPTYHWPSISSPDLVAEPLPEATVTNGSIFTPALGLTTKNTSPERFPFSDDLQYPTSSPEIGQRVIENFSPSQHANAGTVASPRSTIDGSPEIANQSLQLLTTDSEIRSLQRLITDIMSEVDVPLKSAEAEVPQTTDSPPAVDIQLPVSDVDDSILGFHMLDLPEVLSPWVPVSPTAPSVHVPPAVHHLIAGMRHQLKIECRARKRVEELYLEEMRKRIGMEVAIDKLQKKLSTREQDASPTARPFGAYKRRVAGQ